MPEKPTNNKNNILEPPMNDIEKYKPIFPMIYLCLAAIIAIGCFLLNVPEGIAGLLVGAALTRVKIPAPNGKL